MEGKITYKKSIRSDLTLFTIKISNGDSGKCWIVKGFKNELPWLDLSIGDHIDGLRWKHKDDGLIDADSPISLL